MRQHRRFLGLVLGLLLLGAVPAAAQDVADVSLGLQPMVVNAKPGQQISIAAEVFNNSAVDAVSLFGGSGSVLGPNGQSSSAVTWNDAVFVNNMPSTLNAGGTYSGTLFLNIASDAAPGLYTATYTVTGKNDTTGTPFSASDTIRLTVAPVPEVSVLLSLSGGLGGVFFMIRRNRPKSDVIRNGKQ